MMSWSSDSRNNRSGAGYTDWQGVMVILAETGHARTRHKWPMRYFNDMEDVKSRTRCYARYFFLLVHQLPETGLSQKTIYYIIIIIYIYFYYMGSPAPHSYKWGMLSPQNYQSYLGSMHNSVDCFRSSLASCTNNIL